jgi:N-acetylglucosaminyldiphosphoundecaprenol N-acetyl-beta-D-mannosaminyltransferase
MSINRIFATGLKKMHIANMKGIDAASTRVTYDRVCFANVHMTIEAHRDNQLAEQINSASMVLPDGVPLTKIIRLFYGEGQERIAGMDVMPDLIKVAARLALKVYFFGTTPEILEKVIARSKYDYPDLHIAGAFSPPFDRSLDDESYIRDIRRSGANLVFVALGCPKQEKWMATHCHKIDAVLLGVGGAFPLYAGITKRAPLWLRNLSLEWLFRLAQEPRRLLGRYVTTNSLFLYLVVKTKLKRIFH